MILYYRAVDANGEVFEDSYDIEGALNETLLGVFSAVSNSLADACTDAVIMPLEAGDRLERLLRAEDEDAYNQAARQLAQSAAIADGHVTLSIATSSKAKALPFAEFPNGLRAVADLIVRQTEEFAVAFNKAARILAPGLEPLRELIDETATQSIWPKTTEVSEVLTPYQRAMRERQKLKAAPAPEKSDDDDTDAEETPPPKAPPKMPLATKKRSGAPAAKQ